MGEFEENLQKFINTIYGREMKESLLWCLNILYVNMTNYAEKIRTANSKITELERG